MASKRTFHKYIYTSSNFSYPTTSSTAIHEFDEAEIWSSYGVAAMASKKKPMAVYREAKKTMSKKMIKSEITAVSFKDLQDDVHGKRFAGFKEDEEEEEDVDDEDEEEDEEEDDDDDDEKVPPHEYLARRRGASFSVHEGIGRTLKGRDLSRVRNAVWKKTGFED